MTQKSRTITDTWKKEMRDMVAVKAALWASADIEQLLQKAVAAYQEEIPLRDTYCFECKTETKEVLADYEIPDGRHVVIEQVPTMICPQCKNREWNLRLLAALERLAENVPEGTRMKLTDALRM